MKKKYLFIPIILLFILTYCNNKHSCKKSITNIQKIHYLYCQPDGDDFWRLMNHDDSGWKEATSLQQLSEAIKKDNPKEVYIRFIVDHSSETINNFYFSIRHSGSFHIYINGIRCGGNESASVDMKEYTIIPRRPEQIGKNIYAIYFKHINGVQPVFDIESKNSPFVSTDDGTWRPEPVIKDLLRDAAAFKGPDHTYYLTATRGDDIFLKPNPNYWLMSPGIELYKSTDLKNWHSLGYVWTFERDGTWNKDTGTFCGRGPARGVFAPEIKYFRNKYWLNYSVNHSTQKHWFGIGILSADKPEGPWKEVSPAAPVTDGFDSNLFNDDNGTVYLLKHGGLIAKMKSDLTATAEPFRHLKPANYPYVGYEGVHLFKYKGKYHLSSAEWNVHEDGKISYDSMIASADSIYGPYGDRYCCIRFGGNCGYFTNDKGELFATPWCYPDNDYHWQRVSIVKLKLLSNDKLQIMKEKVQITNF